MIHVACPGCGHEFDCSDFLAGLTVVCKSCDHRVPLPGGPTPAASPATFQTAPRALPPPQPVQQPPFLVHPPVLREPTSLPAERAPQEWEPAARTGEDAPITDEERQGRAILLTYISLMLLTSVAVIALFVLNRGAVRLPAQLVRLALTGLLCFFLYKGSEVARWIAVVLLTVGGALALPGIVAGHLVVIAVSSALAGLYLSFAWALIWSRRVRAFLERQRK